MIGDDPNRSDSEPRQKTGEANGIFNENEIQINERDERKILAPVRALVN